MRLPSGYARTEHRANLDFRARSLVGRCHARWELAMDRTALGTSVMGVRAGAMLLMLVAPLAGCAGSGDMSPSGSRADTANIKPGISGNAGSGAMPTAPATPSDFGNS